MPIDPAVRHLIARFRNSANWDQQLDLQLLQKLWPALAGANLAAAAKIVAIHGSVVTVNVPDLIWRRQLIRIKPQLLAKMNEPWPSPLIKEIAFTYEN